MSIELEPCWEGSCWKPCCNARRQAFALYGESWQSQMVWFRYFGRHRLCQGTIAREFPESYVSSTDPLLPISYLAKSFLSIAPLNNMHPRLKQASSNGLHHINRKHSGKRTTHDLRSTTTSCWGMKKDRCIDSLRLQCTLEHLLVYWAHPPVQLFWRLVPMMWVSTPNTHPRQERG